MGHKLVLKRLFKWNLTRFKDLKRLGRALQPLSNYFKSFFTIHLSLSPTFQILAKNKKKDHQNLQERERKNMVLSRYFFLPFLSRHMSSYQCCLPRSKGFIVEEEVRSLGDTTKKCKGQIFSQRDSLVDIVEDRFTRLEGYISMTSDKQKAVHGSISHQTTANDLLLYNKDH